MYRLKRLCSFVLAAAIALSGLGGVWTASAAELPQQEENQIIYQITIENLTEGQPFSSPVAVTHSGDAAIFHVDDEASDALAAMAQGGDPTPILDAFTGIEQVTEVVDVGRPLTPAGTTAMVEGNEITSSATFTITAAPGDFLSLTTMLICTNDGFTGLDSAVLPEAGEPLVLELNGYDAGREENTELSEDLVDPCTAFGPVALEDAPDGNVDDDVATDPILPIALHPGISGEGDLTVADHGWEEPVAQVTIQQAGEVQAVEEVTVPEIATYEVTLSNLTIGQPFSPPVAVTHAADVSLFQPGETATDALAAIAQIGDPTPIVNAFTGTEGVTEVANVGRPLTPAGETATVDGNEITDRATFTITAAPGDFLSLAAMLICTNDGFTGLNAATLPEEGSDVFILSSYDAGREENTELSEDLVDPCSALGPVALEDDPDGNVDDDVATDPIEPVAVNPGIGGEGDLTVADHGWTEPVATVLVTRVDEPAMMESNGLVTVESNNSFTQTVEILQGELEEQDLLVPAVIDHTANAENADAALPATTLILTGNPDLGTPLMQSSRSIAIDLPQKFLVWEDDAGAVFITYNDPSYLAQRHGIEDQDEILEQIAGALSNFAETAASETAADELETDGLETDELETDELETDELETDELETDELETDETEAGEPGADGPDADELETDETDTDVDEPDADEPGADATATEEAEAMTPSVNVEDQLVAEGMVTVDEVVSDGAGWIVIHADDDGAPGPVIGHAAVEDGVNAGVMVAIDVSTTTETLYAMLHTDAGESGIYEFPGADTPVVVDGEVIAPAFTVGDVETETSEEAVAVGLHR